MIAEYRELVSGPGRYEGEPPMVAYINENDLYDETSGDVESPTGWFGRAGRWMVAIDSSGFVYSRRFNSVVSAQGDFDATDRAYSKWDSDE